MAKPQRARGKPERALDVKPRTVPFQIDPSLVSTERHPRQIFRSKTKRTRNLLELAGWDM